MKQQYKPSKLDIQEWNNKKDKPSMICFLNAFSRIPKKKIKKVIYLKWNKLPKKFQQAWILSHKRAFEEGFPLTKGQIERGCFKL